jgi:hypothetical protein
MTSCVQFWTAGSVSVRYDYSPTKKIPLPLAMSWSALQSNLSAGIEGIEEGNCM